MSAPVLDTLRAQNARWGPSSARDASLSALERGAVAIVTGQQLGVGLGPLYTVHKAASAIAIAAALERAGVPARPIFWLQTEDHDFEEVRTLRWNAGPNVRATSLPERPASRARTSLAHERVGTGIDRVHEALREDLGSDPRAAELLALQTAHWCADALFPEAFGGMLAALFERFGLLTFDPRDARIAPLAAPLHRRALDLHDTLNERLAAGARAIEQSGRAVPIRIRPECGLSFLHLEGPEGPRHRLVPGDGRTIGVSGASDTFSRADLDAMLEQTPLRFSTSALLRPVLQDHLLPVAAYVGGPGELRYAEQLAPIYELLEVTPAPFVRRASFLITSERDREDLAALGLDARALEADLDTLSRGLGACDASAALSALEADVTRTLATLGDSLTALDPGLLKSRDKTAAGVAESLGKLRARTERAAAARRGDDLARLQRVRAALRPDGAPQERVHGLPAVASLGLDRITEAAVDRALDGDAVMELAL